MAKNNNKADIDFEQKLWKTANELRGVVAENKYKDYVLSLIFINHLSDRYKDQILTKCHDPNDGYYTTDNEEISYILTDPDEYLSKGVYTLPLEATWEYLQENAEMDAIKVKVDRDTRN